MKRYAMLLCAMLLAFVVLMYGKASASDGFEAVRCGGDIPAALIGRHSANERVVVTEAHHRDLALKDLGADMITDEINMVDWSICGAEYYVLLDQHDVIRDVLPFPNHSRAAPASSGQCECDGREMNEIIYSVLDNQAGYQIAFDYNDKTLLPVLWAWKVDVKTVKFVKLDVAGMLCSVSAVNDVDRVR
jgi:hypothetical protein